MPLIVASFRPLENNFSAGQSIKSVFVFQSALQSSPWGLMQALEQQVGELKIDIDNGCCDGAQGDTGDSRPSSGTSTDLKSFISHISSNVSAILSLHN